LLHLGRDALVPLGHRRFLAIPSISLRYIRSTHRANVAIAQRTRLMGTGAIPDRSRQLLRPSVQRAQKFQHRADTFLGLVHVDLVSGTLDHEIYVDEPE